MFLMQQRVWSGKRASVVHISVDKGSTTVFHDDIAVRT